MNCEECKNFIRELDDLSQIRNNEDIANHLAACEGCRKALKLEEKLRQSFELIAQEAPPPSLARAILNIQADNSAIKPHPASLTGWFSRCLESFSFKLAFASGLAGFLLAVVMLRSDGFRTAPASVPVDKAAQPVAVRPAAVQPAVKNEMQLAMKAVPQFEAADEAAALPKEASEAVGGEIPGAMSYSLAREESTVEQKAMLPDEFGSAEPPRMVEAEGRVQTAISEDSGQAAGFQVARLARAPEMSRVRAKTFNKDFAIDPESLMDDEEQKKSDSAAPDSRAVEILELIARSGIEQGEGFVDLETLAMKGFIAGDRLHALRPPTGSGWFLTVEAGKKKIVLRKK